MKNITIVGAGSTGHAAAAYFALKGACVCFLEYDEANLPLFDDIEKVGGILLRGYEQGFAKNVQLSTSPKNAINGADLIIICAVAMRHEEIATAIAPHLKNGQHILISPGNLGSFIFRKAIKELGNNATVTVSELEGNLFPARLTGKAEVVVAFPFGKKPFASLPFADTSKVIAAFEGLIELIPCKNIFDVAINANNFVTHLPATILSATAIEKKGDEFCFFLDSITPSSIKLADILSKERRELINAMGLEEHSDPMLHLGKVANFAQHPHLDIFMTLSGPNSVNHRYLVEDALCCGAFALSLGQKLGVNMPNLRALLQIAGALTNFDYINDGRSVDKLGFKGMSYSKMLELL